MYVVIFDESLSCNIDSFKSLFGIDVYSSG